MKRLGREEIMKKEIKIGLLGLGTVGSGVYEILTKHATRFPLRTGANLTVKSILIQDMKKKRRVSVPRDLLTTKPETILADNDIDIIVEVIGGIEPAKSIVIRAINAGKAVVTANKELMANYGKEILELADAKGVDVYFEASVGGGIPIIRPLKQCLAANRIRKVMGIVNGTTNYILTKMSEENMSFSAALKEAQVRGYAEADPSADIEGRDAAAKVAILASIAFNSRVTANDVYTEGIASVTPSDIMYAREMGYAIKLLALAKEDENGIDVRVHPAMIPLAHPLASVKDVYNAIFVEGDAVGKVMFFGPGAGGLPTASAVVGDIIEVAINLQYGRSGKIGCTCFEKKEIKPIDKISSAYYLLMDVLDQPGVLAKIAKCFGDHNVSIQSVIQKQTKGNLAELVFGTHQTREENLKAALEDVRKLPVVDKICNVIRVEE
jgi:homoserine dehydrogenase